jgi:uncharacterized protein YecE (DUF72 family)
VSELRIGTSGWVYPHWRGRFYPRDLPQREWLRYYAERFDTVELNNPFYRQPEKSTFEKWRGAVPDDFRFAVKLNRFITHIKRLNVGPDSIERSYGTLAGLGPKAAVVLIQLPPKMKFAPERLGAYLKLVARRRRRHALEPRDASWLTPEALAFLRSKNVALCLIDTPKWPSVDAVTADFVYIRFHGPERLYASNYTETQLRAWAERIRAWRARGLDVYGYFNNDVPDYAPRNALRLRELAS